jgi:hypothetical protein
VPNINFRNISVMAVRVQDHFQEVAYGVVY